MRIASRNNRPDAPRGMRLLPAAVTAASAALMLGVGSCSTDECIDNKSALPLAGFYGYVGGLMKSISIDSLQIYGIDAPGDSLLFDGKTSVSSLYMPFRIDQETTQYVLHYLEQPLSVRGINDTITFTYTAEPRFVSSACGVSYVFDLKDITTTHYLVDSVSCIGMQITNANKENIRIYMRTDDPDTPPPGSYE